jgi:regulator of extracellular matrix RemA (YlzA/DUF370 family)
MPRRSDPRHTPWKRVTEDLHRSLRLISLSKSRFRSAGRAEIVEDLERCILLLINAEKVAINFDINGAP